MKYAELISEPVPQTEPLDDRQVGNNAGGFVYGLDIWARLERFLILGSDAATYYQSARDLTKQNVSVVAQCYTEDAARTVQTIIDVSNGGRAPKNDAAIFALAIGAAHSDVAIRRAALADVPVQKVLRTSTHLFQFVGACRALGRGWGRSLKRAVANWYAAKSTGALAYQTIKYRSRDGYSHKRLLQTSHPDDAASDDRVALYRWICGKEYDESALPSIVHHHLAAMSGLPKGELLSLIREHNLPWEALPTEVTTDPDVWAAMLPSMGLTALIRNLGSMTSYGALKPMSEGVSVVIDRLRDAEVIKKSRVHPFQILLALATYRNGRGFKGSLSWTPVGQIVDALDDAFYLAFDNVVPTGKRTMIALDISGSMGTALMGSPLTAREGSAAMAMVSVKTEPWTHVVGFSSAGGSYWGGRGTKLIELPITGRQRLDDVVRSISGLPFGGTDCSLPMQYALERGLDVDVFYIYTDNETYAGRIHPMEALRQYRKKTGINAKLVVVGMTSTGFSIADPADGGAMDVVGFDASAPAVMADFVRS